MYHNYTQSVSKEKIERLNDLHKSLKSNDVNHGNPKLRTSVITALDKYENKDVFDLIYQLGLQANKDAYQFHVNHISHCQFTLYDEKQKGHYDWHMDFRGFSETVKNKTRKITVIVQLSDPSEYEGGELQLKYSKYNKQEKEDMMQQGSVITFPCWLEHRVTPVTKGHRKSLIGWIEGNTWQ